MQGSCWQQQNTDPKMIILMIYCLDSHWWLMIGEILCQRTIESESVRGTRFLFTGFVPNRSNKSAAPIRFGSNRSVRIDRHGWWMIDGRMMIYTRWLGTWWMADMTVMDCVQKRCNGSATTLRCWKLDTYRVGKGSPSLDSPIHTSWSSCCVHMGFTAWS